jgi:hypothetical protein
MLTALVSLITLLLPDLKSSLFEFFEISKDKVAALSSDTFSLSTITRSSLPA